MPTQGLKATLIPDMSSEEYHASPALSASGAKLLLPPSCPAKYKHEREHKTHKDVFDFGSAAHQVVLRSEDELFLVKADSWRTKAARDARAVAHEHGLIPLLEKHYDVVLEMAAKLREHPIASALFSNGRPEQAIFWTDEATGAPLRVKLDWLPNPRPSGRIIAADYKTTATGADAESFARTAMNNGYHVQEAFYTEGIRAARLADDVAFLFVVQEKDPPYLVNVVELDPNAKRIGAHLMSRAIATYAACVATDTWPSYSTDVEQASFPYWYEREFEEIVA